MTEAVLEPVRATFRAVAMTVVPEVEALSPAGWSTLEQTVERALASRPERVRRQLQVLLRAIELLPLATHRGRFSRLGEISRRDVLRRLERAPVLLARRGFWGLRTLVMMGYYTQPEVQDRIGYRAHRDGWAERRRAGGPLIETPYELPPTPARPMDAVPDDANGSSTSA
jgi:hypothetical protein